MNECICFCFLNFLGDFMKKFISRSLFIGSCALIGFACGGGSKSASNVIDDANDAVDAAELETNAETAFAASDWKDQTPGEVNSTNSVTISTNVQTSVSTIVSQATAGISATKANKTTTINHTVNGSAGGNATVTGTYTINTAGAAVYPISYTYDFKIVFNNYKDASIAINGEITYKGSSSIPEATSNTTELEINGGYSVLYQNVAYNVVTKLEAKVTITNSTNVSITYTYTVNGETYTNET